MFLTPFKTAPVVSIEAFVPPPPAIPAKYDSFKRVYISSELYSFPAILPADMLTMSSPTSVKPSLAAAPNRS